MSCYAPTTRTYLTFAIEYEYTEKTNSQHGMFGPIHLPILISIVLMLQSNPDTPQDPPAGRIVTLRTRANKRSLPDESAPESRPGKQTRTAAVLSSGKDQVEETDQNGMTDEDSSSDYEQDSDEETLQGPSLPFEEEESQDGIETIVIDDGNNDPESHQNGEEEAEVHRPDAEENTDEPVSRSTVSETIHMLTSLVSSLQTHPRRAFPAITPLLQDSCLDGKA